jgi:hypothetical protein
MSAVACFAEPNLGRKIPENLGHPIAKKCTTRGGFFLAEILTATCCETLLTLGGSLK